MEESNLQRVYVKCEISQGMFENEYSIVIGTDEIEYSMFLPRNLVNTELCEIEATLLEDDDNFALISLPRYTIEGTKTIKVNKSIIRYKEKVKMNNKSLKDYIGRFNKLASKLYTYGCDEYPFSFEETEDGKLKCELAVCTYIKDKVIDSTGKELSNVEFVNYFLSSARNRIEELHYVLQLVVAMDTNRHEEGFKGIERDTHLLEKAREIMQEDISEKSK